MKYHYPPVVYYNWDGIPFEEWAALWQGNRTVARDVKGEILVVTSFLGIDGMIFETLVRIGDKEVEMVRTRNEHDAMWMHMAMKKKWMGEDGDDED